MLTMRIRANRAASTPMQRFNYATLPRDRRRALPARRSPAGAQAQSRGRALQQYLAAETNQPRRPAAGGGADLAGFLDETLLLDQPAEILLVQPGAGKRLDGALQLQQREGGHHQLEHHRTVF